MSKPHPEDIDLARQIGRATHFTAYFRRGPFAKWREECPTYETAAKRADELAAEHGIAGQGKRGLVYAITPEGYSIACTPALYAMSQAGA